MPARPVTGKNGTCRTRCKVALAARPTSPCRRTRLAANPAVRSTLRMLRQCVLPPLKWVQRVRLPEPHLAVLLRKPSHGRDSC